MAQVPPPEHAPHRGRFGEETYTQDSIVKVRLRRRRTTDAIPTEFAPVGYEVLSYRASAGMSTIYSDKSGKVPAGRKTHPNSADSLRDPAIQYPRRPLPAHSPRPCR